MTGNTQKIGAIIIYLDILFTRDHFPAWLGTGVSETEGRRNGGGGDHRGLETAGTREAEEDGRGRNGRQERDNVMSAFEMMRVFMGRIYSRHQA